MPPLARALVQAGRISMQDADALSKKAVADKSAFIDVLLASGLIDARALALYCSETFGYPLLDFSSFNLQNLPEKVIDHKLMQSQRAIALARRGNKLS
ncbi:MAG: type IV-A pilus assembly ATPase PilB, partial [Lacisediminimonas sp.]|nr:type IV-A pilus assembly ATPase PilB [Lacisediminimonas sp.]